MKNSSTTLFIIFLVLIAGLLGYNYFAQPFAVLPDVQTNLTQVTPSPEASVSAEINQLKLLSDDQKIAQLLAVPLTIDLSDQTASPSISLNWLKQNQVGTVTLFGNNIDASSAAKIITTLNNQSESSLPLWIAVDHEGGSVQRLNGSGFTKLASWQSICQLSEDEIKQRLAASAQELASAGIKVVLAPVLDMGENMVLKQRVCSQSAAIIEKNAQIYRQIFKDAGILSVFKHFPGIGQTTKDLHQNFDRVTVTLESASVFRNVLNSDSQVGMMVTHVGVKNQHADIPCSLSPDCVNELANNFPQTLIFSDALEMKSAFYSDSSTILTLPIIAEKAVRAGNQILIFGPSVSEAELITVKQHLLIQYQQDEQFRSKVDRAVTQILIYKQLF